MPDNNLFHVLNEHYSLLNYVKNLLKHIPYSEQETKDGMLFTIHFQTELQKDQFFTTIKKDYPKLLV